jgi:hypothetical protein
MFYVKRFEISESIIGLAAMLNFWMKQKSKQMLANNSTMFGSNCSHDFREKD